MKKYFLFFMLVSVVSVLYFSKNDLGKLFASLGTDTRVPYPPYMLKTSISNYNQINLSWVNDSINEGNSIPVTEYKVSRRQSYTGTWLTVGTTAATGYSDYNMAPGSYDYKVIACNLNGCSIDSTSAMASFAKDSVVPTRPENFTVPQKETTDTKANLYWSPSTDDVLLKSYNIYRSTGSAENFSFIASVSSSQLSYSDTTLSPVTHYFYYVRAMDVARNESLSSSTGDIITLTLNNLDSYIRVVYPNNGECFTLPGNLHVAWTGSNLNQANVYYGSNRIFSGRDTSTDWYMTASVSPTTLGYVRVVAVDDKGIEGLSDTNDKSFTISLNCNKEAQVSTVIPAVPSFFRANIIAGNADINLNWQDNSTNENEFRVYRRKLPDGPWQMLVNMGPNIVTYTDTNVPPGDYEYDANACNISGCSIYSNQARITAIASLPEKLYSSSELKSGDMLSAGGSSDPDVYIINEHGYKRLFLNPVIFGFYGHLGGYQNIKNTMPNTRDSYKTSGLFQNCETKDSKVYGVEITSEDAATLHWINTTGEQAVIDDSDFFKKVFCINNNEFNWYQKGSDYESVNQIPSYSR